MANQEIATEEQFQAQCALWYWNTFKDKMLFTVDNNVSHRVLSPHQRMIEGSRKKAQGVIAGVSDFIFVDHMAVHFIELKLKNGVQSEEQKIFASQVSARGHQYHIVRPPLDNFKNLILCLKTIMPK